MAQPRLSKSQPGQARPTLNHRSVEYGKNLAVTTILVLHAGVIGHRVLRHQGYTLPRRGAMRACAQGVRGALPPGREVWGAFAPPRAAGEFGGRHAAQC